MPSFQEYKSKLAAEGLLLLEDESNFKGSNNNYFFQCPKGHTWKGKMSVILDRGIKRETKGCPHCAKEVTDKLSEEAVERNLIPGHKILSYRLKEVKKGVKERVYSVECSRGHQYEKKTPALKEGCPTCSVGVFVGEERVRVMFETHFNKKFAKQRPNWLINPTTGVKLELDGYNEELKIAFEYHGKQHFTEKTQFGETFFEQSKRDIIKQNLCAKNGIKLYIIYQSKSYEHDKFKRDILEQLEKQGLEIKEGVAFNFDKISEDELLKEKYETFKQLVQKTDVTLITNQLSTMDEILDFKCKNNHLFKLSGKRFKEIISNKNDRDYFCITCQNEEGKNLPLINSVITFNDVKQFAESIKYQLNETQYRNVNEKMNWTCSNGHTVIKSYRQFQRNKTGNYCEQCLDEKLVKPVFNGEKTRFTTSSGDITLEQVKDFAKEINYQLNETQYKNVNEKMNWTCPYGHTVMKSYRQFQRNKTGNYCEACVQEKNVKAYRNLDNPNFQSNNQIINLKSAQEFATSIGYTLNETEYKNVSEKMNWTCSNGHTVIKSYRQFQRNKTGNYCDSCMKKDKKE